MEMIDQVRVRVLPGGRVNRNDAATYLGRKPKTLAMWALEGKGPKPHRVGGRIFYMLADLGSFVRGDAVTVSAGANPLCRAEPEYLFQKTLT